MDPESESNHYNLTAEKIIINKWPDKSTTSYDMLDFKSCTHILTLKYLVIERHMLQIQGLLLQHLKLNWPICPLQFFLNF